MSGTTTITFFANSGEDESALCERRDFIATISGYETVAVKADGSLLDLPQAVRTPRQEILPPLPASAKPNLQQAKSILKRDIKPIAPKRSIYKFIKDVLLGRSP